MWAEMDQCTLFERLKFFKDVGTNRVALLLRHKQCSCLLFATARYIS